MVRTLLFPLALLSAAPPPHHVSIPPNARPTHETKPNATQVPVSPSAKPTKAPTQSQPLPRPSARAQSGGKTPFASELALAWNASGLRAGKLPAYVGDSAAALSGFSLAFTNGDHKLQRIGVYRGELGMTSELSDRDGDDPYAFAATYRILPGIAAKKAPLRTTCRVACDLAIDRPRAGEVFVLTGFLFARPATDRKVHRIAVRPFPERGVVRVELDDGNGLSKGSAFKAEIQYAYVSADHVGLQSTDSAVAGRGGTLSLVEGRWGKPRAIQGFDVQFVGGGHFVKKLRIADQDNSVRVALQDRDGNDAVMGSVQTVTLVR